MASNIFNDIDYNNVLRRIEFLEINNQKLWGKMSIEQMLKHCATQLRLALGIIQVDSEGSSFMRTTLGRWLILYLIPWPRDLKTPEKMDLVQNEISGVVLESEKKSLIDLLEQVKMQTQLNPHPFFGEMNKKDWGRLIWKHLDHHLRQFNG